MKRILLIFLLSTLLIRPIYASSSGWIILRKIQSAKPSSLVSLTSNDISGILFNPSLTNFVKVRQIMAFSEAGFTGENTAGLVLVSPLDVPARILGFSLNAVSISLAIYSAGRVDLFWIENGEERKKTVNSENDIIGGVTYGGIIPLYQDNINFGITLKFASSKLADVITANAMAVDVSAMTKFKNRIYTSFAIKNFGVSTPFDKKKESLPLTLWCGTGYENYLPEIGDDFFYKAGCDLSLLLNDGKIKPSFSIEAGKPQFSCFLGFNPGRSQGTLTFGFSFEIKNIKLFEDINVSYSYTPSDIFSPVHRLSLGTLFNNSITF